MNVSRRRFITISAASCLVSPSSGAATEWRGTALGAEVSVKLNGTPEKADAALKKALSDLRAVERMFSLYDTLSDLSRLNRDGFLDRPDDRMVDLFALAGEIFSLTLGLFDPSVQPLWRAFAEGREPSTAVSLVDWSRVRHSRDRIRLDKGQALTFNGIAQGYATDIVAHSLKATGFESTLVNVGELRAGGGPWKIGISDGQHGLLGYRNLTNSAMATSSPDALLLGNHRHILHPTANPVWSTVSVEAESAAIADGFSTAFVMAERSLIRSLVGKHGIRSVVLVDANGELETIRPR